ncbi:ATP-binding protein [Streptantibioticus parmotrematis]|uniref:ATP-binding protein n=1 Tax=Streptantibioticus parmotrematis TaxID=2873249 RepID=UPI0033DD0B9D
MVDPASLTAITTVLGAVGGGLANEAGKAAWESAGVLIRRIAGREVQAPTDADQRVAVARVVLDGICREPALAGAWQVFASGVPRSVPGAAAPQLLPLADRFFTDRRDPLKTLDQEYGREFDGSPRAVLLHGPSGIGTSALAVQWGWREPRRFPDGRLYADLRGLSPDTASDAATVLAHFLRKLGVADAEIPPTTADRAERFRAEVAERRLLVVLDHAHSAAQVKPLLTAAPGVFTVVVARRPLAGLDLLAVPLGPLTERDALRLLTGVAGKPAVTAARPVLPSALARCAGSPFALRALAPRLAELPPTAQQFATAGEPVADDADRDPVRDAVHDLYRGLPPEAARAYRLLAVRPWPWITAGPAGAALNAPETEAADLLARLAGHRLLDTTDGVRYAYRPSVRRHAEGLALREEGIAACAGAVRRMTAWLLGFAVTADRSAHPDRWWLGPLYTSLPPGPYGDDQSAALTALVDELDVLVEAVRAADELEDPATAWQLCEAMWAAQLRAGRHDQVMPALRVGARAADRLDPDSRVAGRLHTQLALALMERREYDDASAELRTAARAERVAGHLRGQATALETLGLLRLRQWRHEQALGLFEEAADTLDGVGPDDEGHADLPRARALLRRHRGRALRGLGRRREARDLGREALEYFRGDGHDPYNAGRTLTDLAEIELDAQDYAAAVPLLDEAIATLAAQRAGYHVDRLKALRAACVSAGG